MPQFSLIPNLNTQPQSPEETTLQDELAKRAQSQWSPTAQAMAQAPVNAGDFLTGLGSMPDNSGSFAKRLGVLAGSMLPLKGPAFQGLSKIDSVLGAEEKIPEAAQTLAGFLNSYRAETTPEDLAHAVANSRVSSRRGNPITPIRVPEGFELPRVLAERRMTGLKTQANLVNQSWANKLKDARNAADSKIAVPTTSSYDTIGDILSDAAHQSQKISTDPRELSTIANKHQVDLSLRRSKTSEDIIKKIRSFPSFEEARDAFPNMERERVRQIYHKFIFPGVK